jgi:GNAT superfamily N-acetyltransferase
MTLTINYLADHPEAVSVVADWIFDEWAHKVTGLTRDSHANQLTVELSRTHAPIQLVALEDRMVVGVAILKPHEMHAVYPDWHHWLGSVIVQPDARGRGVATALCNRIETVARNLNIPRLHLQTERLDGGLYARLGFQPVDEVDHNGYRVLVMAKDLANGGGL